MAQDLLYNMVPPWVILEPITDAGRSWIRAIWYQRESTNNRCMIVVRVLRGRKMRTVQALFDELSAALQFDKPFGENWNAVIDVITNIYIWMPGDAYIIWVRDAQEVLCDEKPKSLRNFLEVMNDAGERWSKPVTDNRQYNRPAVPFHTILNYPPEYKQQMSDRYQQFSDLFEWSENIPPNFKWWEAD